MDNPSLIVNISAATHRGYVRRLNEDAILAGDWIGCGESISHAFTRVADDSGFLLAVADGLGGHRAGEVASRFVVGELLRRGKPFDFTREDSLFVLLREIDADLRGQAVSMPLLQGMGSTLVAAYIAASGLTIANIGDSRAYLFDDRNGLRQVSLDHVPRSVIYEGQRKEGPRTTHAITQAFGGSVSRHSPLRPHILRLPPPPHELTLLLCSDGLSDLIGHDQIANALASTQVGADDLVRGALDAGGIDNVSAIVARFQMARHGASRR
ncbi:PP2C family protein-serine/threonine phosphatase [Komagataeibacter saccharivorans]|uniref:PP2C family protein-serine/threonine phosphatase n=1 Tax=Komagataeibacter saccharivorans TaxID=265959 RepID=UPI0015E063B4|nr:protein phosphatase 2C domain-containing protein [Komagataeibacter saccharivorans]